MSFRLWSGGFGRLGAALVCLATVAAGCGGPAETSPESCGLDNEYVSVGLGEGYIVLRLETGGEFTVLEDDTDRYCEERLRREPPPTASGEWVFDEGRLDLTSEEWNAVFETDSTRVEIPDRADTLSILRWVSGTESSPFGACDLVSAAEFREFLHPKEGSGTSPGL